MDEVGIADITGFDWAGLLETAQTTGVAFGLKLLAALVIFYVGRIVARMLQKALRKIRTITQWKMALYRSRQEAHKIMNVSKKYGLFLTNCRYLVYCYTAFFRLR